MKILVVNLLRIGDILSTLPALKKLRRDFPSAQIDLLINSSFSHMTGVIGHVDGVLFFERDELQKSLVDADRSLFDAYDRLRDQLESLNAAGYDRIINFTHNRLSGWLCGLLHAKVKHGLVLDASGAVSFGDPWFRYLNAQVDIDGGHAINHSDIFLGAVGGWAEAPIASAFDLLLSETERGRAEAEALLQIAEHREPHLVLQLSTSDVKKEWGDDRFRKLIHLLSARYPKLAVFVLGAPNEAKRIAQFCDSVNGSDSAHDVVMVPTIVSLEGAVSVLEGCDILVSGDTSIKHLAAATTVPVVEIALGSADVFRTGSWKTGDIVISSKESCAPCGHSEGCHRTSHACAEGVSPELVAEVVVQRLQTATPSGFLNRPVQDRLQTHRNVADVFVVDRSERLAHPLSIFSELTEKNLALLLERSARVIAVEMDAGRFSDMDYGSAIREAGIILRRQFFDESEADLRYILSLFERELRSSEGLLQSLRLQVARVKENYQEPAQMQIEMQDVIRLCISTRRRLRQSAALAFIGEALEMIVEDDRSTPFARLRKVIDSIDELERRQAIVIKLCRGLEIQTLEGVSV